MCDFSLQHVAARAAQLGDRLLSTQFAGTTTRGFAAVGALDIAVCLRPGTELAFDRPVTCEHPLASFPVRTMPADVARFCRINPNQPYDHHDALEFPDGKIILLTWLCFGQHATVLQLPAAHFAANKMPSVLTYS